MTKEEGEKFYDEEIAPALARLAKKCEDFGLSLVAKVEWFPGETGTTATIRENASICLRMAYMGAAANGNADSLILALQKYGREHGHNSICLTMLDRP